MPIKPENRSRYPSDWPQIRARILARARNRCETPGCNAQQYDAGYWGHWGGDSRPTWFRLSAHETHAAAKQAAAEHSFDRFGDGPVPKGDAPIIVIVLTVAHLDHMPENCADANLQALCQRCHLRLDAGHHAETARATRHARKAVGDLFAFSNHPR